MKIWDSVYICILDVDFYFMPGREIQFWKGVTWTFEDESVIKIPLKWVCKLTCKQKGLPNEIYFYHYCVHWFQSDGLHFPDKKRLAFRNLVQVPKVWSVFIHASFLVHFPQFRSFFILPDGMVATLFLSPKDKFT